MDSSPTAREAEGDMSRVADRSAAVPAARIDAHGQAASWLARTTADRLAAGTTMP